MDEGAEAKAETEAAATPTSPLKVTPHASSRKRLRAARAASPPVLASASAPASASAAYSPAPAPAVAKTLSVLLTLPPPTASDLADKTLALLAQECTPATLLGPLLPLFVTAGIVADSALALGRLDPAAALPAATAALLAAHDAAAAAEMAELLGDTVSATYSADAAAAAAAALAAALGVLPATAAAAAATAATATLSAIKSAMDALPSLPHAIAAALLVRTARARAGAATRGGSLGLSLTTVTPSPIASLLASTHAQLTPAGADVTADICAALCQSHSPHVVDGVWEVSAPAEAAEFAFAVAQLGTSELLWSAAPPAALAGLLAHGLTAPGGATPPFSRSPASALALAHALVPGRAAGAALLVIAQVAKGRPCAHTTTAFGGWAPLGDEHQRVWPHKDSAYESSSSPRASFEAPRRDTTAVSDFLIVHDSAQARLRYIVAVSNRATAASN